MKHLKKIRLNIARYILLCSVICRNCSQLLFFNLRVRDVVVNSLFWKPLLSSTFYVLMYLVFW